MMNGNGDRGLEIAASAKAMIPLADSRKAEFLAYLALGFNISEAAGLIGVSRALPGEWRKTDVEFAALWDKLPEIREELLKNVIDIAYIRNFLMVLEKDRRIISKSLSQRVGEDGEMEAEPMTQDEFKYLTKVRAHYTPQQFQALRQNASILNSLPDFSEFVLAFRAKEKSETIKRIGSEQD